MSTVEATLSMLESMPEEARHKVFLYTRELFSSERPSNPFTPVSESQVLADLEKATKEFGNGEGVDAVDAISSMRKQHGFI